MNSNDEREEMDTGAFVRDMMGMVTDENKALMHQGRTIDPTESIPDWVKYARTDDRPRAERDTWIIYIPNWVPPSCNVGRGKHWSIRHSVYKTAVELLKGYAFDGGVKLVNPPTYIPVRRLAVYVDYGRYHKGKLPDPHNLTKLLYDATKAARLIVDDSAKWLLWERPIVYRKLQDPNTEIVLADYHEPLPTTPGKRTFTTSRGERV